MSESKSSTQHQSNSTDCQERPINLFSLFSLRPRVELFIYCKKAYFQDMASYITNRLEFTRWSLFNIACPKLCINGLLDQEIILLKKLNWQKRKGYVQGYSCSIIYNSKRLIRLKAFTNKLLLE